MFIKLFSYPLCLCFFYAYMQASDPRYILLDSSSIAKNKKSVRTFDELVEAARDKQQTPRRYGKLETQRGIRLNGDSDQQSLSKEKK